jgi:hypothetical protein
MATIKLLPTLTAAAYLGVTAEALRSWRRRGIGPAYVRIAGADYRDRNHEWREWAAKKGGTILYPLDDLDAFITARTVQAGRLPRQNRGRSLGGGKRAKGPPRA